ncbi:MAG: PfkB family carbohydrate kinase [Pseudomonadota bacterium]
MTGEEQNGSAKKCIIVIGHAALDEVYRVAHLPTTPGKFRAFEHRTCGGGSAANAACAVARLDGWAAFWGRTGDDLAGTRIRSSLVDCGVDVNALRAFNGARTSQCAVVVDSCGERMVITERDHAMPMKPDWLPIANVGQSHAVLSDLTWHEATVAAFSAAREHRVPTIIDADVASGLPSQDILQLTDYAIFSQAALEQVFEGDTTSALLSHVCALRVPYAGVTLGAGGYQWLRWNEHIAAQPAFEVEAIDTTGAGDAFHGAFAWAVARGLDDRECARLASAAAAMSCRALGARTALPTVSELDVFLRERTGSGFELRTQDGCRSAHQKP